MKFGHGTVLCIGRDQHSLSGLGKGLLRYESHTNRINHCQYPLYCDGNFLTKNLTFTFPNKINTSQWYWPMTANKQYHFQVTKIVFFAKHILTTVLRR